jgi:hypothetical protein
MSPLKCLTLVGVVFSVAAAWGQSVFVNNPVIPTYPALATGALLQGEITVEIEIGKDGRVLSAKASGGNEILLRATEKNISAWTFGLTSETKSFPVKHTIIYVYKLVGERTRDTGCTSVVFHLPDRIEISARPPTITP